MRDDSIDTGKMNKFEKLVARGLKKFEKYMWKETRGKEFENNQFSLSPSFRPVRPGNKDEINNRSFMGMQIELIHDAKAYNKALNKDVEEAIKEDNEKKAEAEAKLEEIMTKRDEAIEEQKANEADLTGSSLCDVKLGCNGELLSAVLKKDGKLFRLRFNFENNRMEVRGM